MAPASAVEDQGFRLALRVVFGFHDKESAAQRSDPQQAAYLQLRIYLDIAPAALDEHDVYVSRRRAPQGAQADQFADFNFAVYFLFQVIESDHAIPAEMGGMHIAGRPAVGLGPGGQPGLELPGRAQRLRIVRVRPSPPIGDIPPAGDFASGLGVPAAIGAINRIGDFAVVSDDMPARGVHHLARSRAFRPDSRVNLAVLLVAEIEALLAMAAQELFDIEAVAARQHGLGLEGFQGRSNRHFHRDDSVGVVLEVEDIDQPQLRAPWRDFKLPAQDIGADRFIEGDYAFGIGSGPYQNSEPALQRDLAPGIEESQKSAFFLDPLYIGAPGFIGPARQKFPAAGRVENFKGGADLEGNVLARAGLAHLVGPDGPA